MWATVIARRAGIVIFYVVASILLAACGGAGSVPGGGSHPGQTPPGKPVLDNWVTFAHDAKHTSASAASLTGSLKQAWRYNPVPLSGNTFGSMFCAIATTAGVYTHWSQYGTTVFAGGPSYDGLSTSGAHLWTYVEHRDYDEGHWLSIFNNEVVYQDDQQGFLNIGTGAVVSVPGKPWGTGFDLWGETIPDPSGLYAANTFLADGADLFVYSLDSTGAARWRALQQKSTKYSQDSNGGLVLSNGTLFYAANYSDPSPNSSGIYALNSSTGAVITHVATTPVSEMSADANNIYLVELPSNLVARSQSNLQKVWSVNLTAYSFAPPVLANGLVIVSSFNGVEAHDATTGKVVWTSPVRASSSGQYSSSMFAALGSSTLLVTSFDALHLLNLSTGAEIWHGGVAGAANPVIVSDPALGVTVYVTDGTGVIALVPG